MKKINLGIVCLIMVIFCLTSYIIYDESVKNDDKENIKKVLTSYMKTYNQFSSFESKYQDINKKIDINYYNDYLKDMKKGLSEYVLEEKQDKIFEIYKKRVDKQYLGNYMYKKYNKEFIDVVEYNFNEDLIYVTFEVEATIDRDERVNAVMNYDSNRYEGIVTNTSTKTKLVELIIFKKVGNEYKIVMHNIADLILGYENPAIGGMGL